MCEEAVSTFAPEEEHVCETQDQHDGQNRTKHSTQVEEAALLAE